MKDCIARVRRIPLLAGGDDLEDVLQGIRDELEQQTTLAATGNAEAATRVTALRDQLAAATAAAGGNGGEGGGTATATATRTATTLGVDDAAELSRLRELERSTQLSSRASDIAERIILGVRQEQRSEEEMLQKMVEERVRSALSGGVFRDQMRELAVSNRGESRFVTPDATPDLLDHVANGGGYSLATRHAHANGTQGELKGVDYMRKNHPMGQLIRAIYMIKSGRATEVEHAFFQESMRKALAEGTPSAGGSLIPLEYMPDILAILRPLAIVRQAASNFRNFARQVQQLSISTGSVAYYTPENAQGQISELTFGETPILTRHNLMGLVPVSNILLQDAAEVENIVRQDMAEVMALREDLAFLRGTGTSGEPLGMRNMVGVTLDPIATPANGFQPSLFDLRRIRARFRALNARNPRPVWFFNTAFITYLETLADAFGRPLLETPLLDINADGITGTLDGIPFFASNQIPIGLVQGSSTNSTDLMLVDMNNIVIGTGTEMEVDVSTEATYWDGTQWVSTYQNNQSLFRTFLSHDIAGLRPQLVIVQRGVLV